MTGRAPGAKADLQSSPQVPRGGLSGRIGPRPRKTKTDHRSFGTIVEARGRFKVRYTGPDKQLHRAGMTFSTRERAQGWLAGELKLIEYGEWTPPAQRRIQAEAEAEAAVINFDEYARDWISTRMVKGRPIKARTREHYLDIHDRLFRPLHRLPLAAISPTTVDRWYRALPEAPTMRAHAYSLLKSIFRTAVSRKLVAESPVNVEGATARNTPKDIELLTIDQIEQLADAMPERHRLLVLMAAWAGLRFGELTALRRRDLDLEHGTVKIERAVVTVGGQRVLTTPKSAAGNRTVHLPTNLLGEIGRHLAQHTGPNPDDLVFPGNQGTPLTPGQVYGHAPRFDKKTKRRIHPGNGFYRARHEIGRPDFRFHDLRHFAATMAAISGATTKELMQFAGHNDIHVAMRYQETINDRKRDLAARMGALASRGTGNASQPSPGSGLAHDHPRS